MKNGGVCGCHVKLSTKPVARKVNHLSNIANPNLPNPILQLPINIPSNKNPITFKSCQSDKSLMECDFSRPDSPDKDEKTIWVGEDPMGSWASKIGNMHLKSALGVHKSFCELAS